MSISRRDVIVRGGAFTAAGYRRVSGANDRIRVAVIGSGGRGLHVSRLFAANADAQITAVCDVYRPRAESLQAVHAGSELFSDHRALLDKAGCDAVLITTPDHWHVPVGVDALNAGKDVYIEKPLTLRTEEGPLIIKAARDRKRMCQVGMQRRSSAVWRSVKEQIIDTGKLGKVTLVRTWWHGNAVHLLRAPEELRTKPDTLDWDRFVGPLKKRPYDPQQFYSWRAYLDYGGGMITDLFTHLLDASHMLLGIDSPVAAVASGGVYHYKQDRTAPDTITAALEYPDQMTMTFDGTLVPGAAGVGVIVYGTGGRLEMAGTPTFVGISQQPEVIPVVRPERPPGVIDGETFLHVRNFLDCMRTRKLPNGDVEIGHRSAAASHLATQAYIQKKRITLAQRTA